jgi:hypothetical protein
MSRQHGSRISCLPVIKDDLAGRDHYLPESVKGERECEASQHSEWTARATQAVYIQWTSEAIALLLYSPM